MELLVVTKGYQERLVGLGDGERVTVEVNVSGLSVNEQGEVNPPG
jgi:hypothetical protein